MKNLKNFNEFLLENYVSFELEKTFNSLKLDWKEDDDYVESIYDEIKGSEDAIAYLAINRSRNREYVFKSWRKNKNYFIELTEDETVIFSAEYDPNEKRFFEQDCFKILGFSL